MKMNMTPDIGGFWEIHVGNGIALVDPLPQFDPNELSVKTQRGFMHHGFNAITK